MSLLELSQRSKISSPVARYGYSVERVEAKRIVYDGQLLPKFLLDNNGDPRKYREFLAENRIGSVFNELTPGRAVIIPRKQ